MRKCSASTWVGATSHQCGLTYNHEGPHHSEVEELTGNVYRWAEGEEPEVAYKGARVTTHVVRVETCNQVVSGRGGRPIRCLGLVGHEGLHRTVDPSTGHDLTWENFNKSVKAPIVTHASGKVSSAIPPFHLIPRAGPVAGARRFARGVRIKKDGAWNACSKDQEAVMEDREFLMDRLGHVIDHAYKALARLNGTLPPETEEDLADGGDAGAIFFGACLLASVVEYNKKKGDTK